MKNNMRIPKEIKIGGHKFKVLIKEMSGKMGECDFSKNTISLSEDISVSQREATFFHEILHAINSEWDNQFNGHVFLEAVSQQLYQVMSDNKMLK